MANLRHKLLLVILIAFIAYYYANGTLSKQSKKKSKKEKTEKLKYSKTNVLARGLVSENVEPNQVLENYAKYCEAEKNIRHFNTGQVLGYVTPWNSHGYDVAKTFGKFSMLSPVWLQIKRKPRGKFHVTGIHDIDKGWIKDTRKINVDVQILPRVLFDGWSIADYKALFTSEDEIEEMCDSLAKVLVDNGMDGAVIEVWSQMPRKKAKDAIHMLSHMSDYFQNRDLTLILVIPPPINFEGKPTAFTSDHFKQLAPLVDGFSLMTYDFSAGSGKLGPNSPGMWMRACVENLDPDRKYRKKILLGLNFYGYAYSPQGGAPIIGQQYVQVLQSYLSKFTWDSGVQEHIIEQNVGRSDKSYVMFPTLKSIHSRLEIARELGTGVAIWEIGQGLDYFYDLL